MRSYLRDYILWVVVPGGVISAGSVAMLAVAALALMILLKKVPLAGILGSAVVLWIMS